MLARLLLALTVAVTAAAPAPAATTTELSPGDRALIGRIQDYLEGLDTLRARFSQRSSDGTRARGELWLDRPGKLHFAYDPPPDLVMVANGSWLLYYDREAEQTSYIPLSETPLYPLLKENIHLLGSETFAVADASRGRGGVSLTLVRGTGDAGSPGSLTLMFRDDPLRLRQWRLIDQQGTVTQVRLTEVERGVTPPEGHFVFNELDLPERDPGPPK